jgi:hypothetical protein
MGFYQNWLVPRLVELAMRHAVVRSGWSASSFTARAEYAEHAEGIGNHAMMNDSVTFVP